MYVFVTDYVCKLAQGTGTRGRDSFRNSLYIAYVLLSFVPIVVSHLSSVALNSDERKNPISDF